MRTNLKDSIGVNLESDFDLWHAAGGWGDVGQVKLAEQVVVFRHGALSFKHLNREIQLLKQT